MEYIRKYGLVTSHRNAVLKNIAFMHEIKDNLSIWNEQLAFIGARLSLMRHQYAVKLDEACRSLYAGITENKEMLNISYQSNIYGSDYDYPDDVTDEMIEIYLNKLIENTDEDIKLGYTHIGLHRDDLELKINGLNVKTYGSQGQKKSCALVMKLAQADILRKESGEPPVILLDDIMSELDSSRQRLVTEIVKDMQVFITSCNPESIPITDDCLISYMDSGVLSQD